jgi:hypothetical protein
LIGVPLKWNADFHDSHGLFMISFLPGTKAKLFKNIIVVDNHIIFYHEDHENLRSIVSAARP